MDANFCWHSGVRFGSQADVNRPPGSALPPTYSCLGWSINNCPDLRVWPGSGN
jgi:hypothetical protein